MDRNHLFWGWLFFLAFVIAGSLEPFHFTLDHSLRENFVHFLTNYRYRIEIWRNVLFYLPLGFYSAALLLRRKISRSYAISFSTVLGLVLSVSLELIQGYSSARDSTINDAIFNIAGTWLGAFLGALFFRPVHFHFQKTWDHGLRRKPLLFFIALYAALIFLGGMLPLDISISPRYFEASWHAIRWIPFDFPGGLSHADLLHMTKDFLIFASFSALLYAVLCFYALPFSSIAGVVMLVTGFSFLIEGLQFFILSRITDMTDVTIAFAAALTGAVFSNLAVRSGWNLQKNKLTVAVYVICGAFLLLIPSPYESWWYFKPNQTYPYLYKTPFFVLQNIFLTAFLFAPLSGLCYAQLKSRAIRRPALILITLFFAIALVSFYLEKGNSIAAFAAFCFAVCGSLMGWRAARRIKRIHPQVL